MADSSTLPARVEFTVTDEGPGTETMTLVGDAYGDPSGQPVVLLHGGGQTRHSWGNTAASIAHDGWRAYAVDMRGHGESGYSPSGAYTASRFGHDLVAIASHLDSKPVVVGASLGGLAGLLAAGSYSPDSFAALVLVDITPRPETVGVNRVVGFMLDRAEEGFATLDEAADAVGRYNPHRPRPTDLSGLRKNLRLGEDGRWRWHWDPALFNSQNGLAGVQEPGQFQRAAEALAIPTLLVRGRQSDLVSPESAQEFLATVPHAEFVDVSGAGHMVAGDRNDRFCDAVSEFLSRR
ncbi:MAG: alpha/beta hydrolase [Microthrixaceae bacterium]|nr:alpha/beta hydrolase [Microthrixaceae bacterium]